MNDLIVNNIPALNNLLLKWYNDNKRELPWRDASDPYIIWISEIILQQTRVNQGYGYFVRFVERFPNVNALAEAEEEEVLKLWQGLGYYSRARNLHAAAKDIMNRFGGVFPYNYEDVASLKGIGSYTAAAITSFAYNQPYAVVDGNVFRVLSRLFAIDTPINTGKGKKEFELLAQSILDKKNPGVYNQAIMEFGALHCIPVNPGCNICPLSTFCISYKLEDVSHYPVKIGKTQVKNRYFNYFDIRFGEYSYLRKREDNDIWKNLYEFPLIETDNNVSTEEILNDERFGKLFGSRKIHIKLVSQVKHILSHRNIYANFYQVDIPDDIPEKNGIIKVKREEIHLYPVSRLVHKYMEHKDY